MVQLTRIDGTAYAIKAGRAMAGSTAYELAGGRTMVDGTVYDIALPEPLEPIPDGMVGITIKAWDPPCGYVEVNGEKIDSVEIDGVYIYEPGAVVRVQAWSANIIFNGECVGSWSYEEPSPIYTFTLSSNVTMYTDYSVAIYIETE